MGKKSIIFSVLLCISLFLSACAQNDAANIDSNSPTVPLPHEYDVIINNIINAYPWNDDETTMVPENPELSYLYRRNSALSEIGFALIDLDNNGQKELVISDISKPFIYDLYTISEGEAIHLVDSGERYRYYLYENGYLENQWSGGGMTSGYDFYRLNGSTLDFIERITTDAYHALDIGMIGDISAANDKEFYFRSESDQPEGYKPITSEEATKAIEAYRNENKSLAIEYTLLSEYKKAR